MKSGSRHEPTRMTHGSCEPGWFCTLPSPWKHVFFNGWPSGSRHIPILIAKEIRKFMELVGFVSPRTTLTQKKMISHMFNILISKYHWCTPGNIPKNNIVNNSVGFAMMLDRFPQKLHENWVPGSSFQVCKMWPKIHGSKINPGTLRIQTLP